MAQIGPSRGGSLLSGVLAGLEDRRREASHREHKKELLKLEQDKIKIEERGNELRARGQDIQREIAESQERAMGPLRQAEAMRMQAQAAEAMTNMQRAMEQSEAGNVFNMLAGEYERQGAKPGPNELSRFIRLGVKAGRDPVELTRQFEVAGWITGSSAKENQKIALIEYLKGNLKIDTRAATDIVMGTDKASFVSKMVNAYTNSIEAIRNPRSVENLTTEYGSLWESLRGGEQGVGGGGRFRYNPATDEYERVD